MTEAPDRHRHFMELALADAKEAKAAGDVGVASLVVIDDDIVGRGRNRASTANDPLAHAETVAITDAFRRVGADALARATLYTTMEPCPMCAGAIQIARIPRVVLGARHRLLPRDDLGRYTLETFREFVAQELDVVTGVMTTECLFVRRPES